MLGGLLACRSIEPIDPETSALLPQTGAVVTEHPLATKVGLEILARGGNAADAAVASALALAVVYPQAGNLGGGGFAIWSPQGESPTALDFREVAPAGYEARLYLDEEGEVVTERSLTTPLAVGVPGSPAGLFALYTAAGSRRFSFGALCAPAILLAEQGFSVDAWLARSLARERTRDLLTADPGAAALFYPEGRPLSEGDLLVQPALAGTLRRLARGGPPGFYQGETAEALLASLKAADERAGGVTRGGDMTPEDLAGYRVVERDPIVGWFRGMEVVGMPPPSSGGVALMQVLATLDGLPLDAERERTLAAGAPLELPGGISPRAAHFWIEAMRRAFADRAEHLGDPDFHSVPVAQLLSASYLSRSRFEVGERANYAVGPMTVTPPDGSSDTTHLSVIDSDGNAVSLTTTLNGSYGSGIYVADAGFLLNNELDDFSIRAGTPNMFGLVGGAANQLVPGKRPLSSMTPTVIRDSTGGLVLVIGAPGGPRIITSVIQVILRVFVYGQPLAEAVASPRLHQQWRPEVTRFEAGWPEEFLSELSERHEQVLEIWGGGFGLVQAIRVHPDGAVEAASDPRGGGMAGIEGQESSSTRLPDLADR